MTLADNWGYVPNDRYKSPAKVIHSLIEVVAKGGSLLLGVGPKPDGTLPEEAVQRMATIGQWLEKNGAAIYGTRALDAYNEGATFFTVSKSGDRKYALVTLKEGEAVPKAVEWKAHLPRKGTQIKLLQTGETVKWAQSANGVRITLPAHLVNNKAAYPALAFSFVPESK